MIEKVGDNKRIAKNTLFLYIRMLITIVVSLYTSRVVLATLGVEDYGIYGVVGGVVTMLSFLNSSMSGATSRFLTFEYGRSDLGRVKKTFSSALIVHIIIAFIVFILCETVGLWFLHNKMVIPSSRFYAAQWVYQLSILSAMLGITQVPYNACIIAREKMDIFAYIEIFNSLAKLFIVYLLVLGPFDKLIFYSILMCIVSFIVMMINRIYCVRRFPESKFEWIWDKEFLKPLVSFSGWDLFGNLSCTIYQQGTNFLINIFFGVVYNAASGIANTITGVIRNFCNNILMAFRPQIIKLYSIGEINQSVNLLYQATKLSTSLLIILIIPIIFEIDFIMNLWLKEPPPYAGVFCKLLLINACFTMIEWALSIGIHATGKIKSISIFGGLCFLLSVPILWICFKYGFPIETAYIICIPTSIIVIIVKSIIYKTYVPIFSYNNFIVTVLFPLLILALCNISGVYLSTYWISPGFLHFVVSISTDIIISIVVIYFIILNTNQREKIIKFIKFKLKINR